MQHLDARDKLVAFTLGGNDIQFVPTMTLCLAAGNCQLNDPLITSLISRAEPRLASVYTEVLSAAPRAQVYVLGYPHLFPTKKIAKRCVGLQLSETRWFNQKVDKLNAVIQRGVMTTNNARLHYVDTTAAFSGGEACSPSHLFMNEIDPVHPRYSFHPTTAGQLMLAAALAHAVRGH